MGSVGTSTNDIIATLDSVNPGQFGGDEVERLRVRAAARRLLARVETPYERAWGFCFEHPAVFAALQIAIDLGIWKAWTKNDGGKKTIDERLFRLLAALYVVEETGVDTFKPTPFSYAIGDESTKVRASLEAATYQYISAGQNLSKYLAKIGYKVPTAAEDNNYAGSDPDGLKLIEGADLSKRLVVDVGGNTGIDISHVLKARLDLPKGALVLQDLPKTIERADVDEKITAMVHDFFKPQPLKGSRAYFMHAVLHDWPDAQATQLLKNTKDAMTKGYSKLFIYDIVLPPTEASISQTTMDVQMMSLLSASE
ncbi:hypothetical protein IL306_002044 [Fusarium sp. DS 682]|nr:hypothetical protein IL306_002044 [Fusarium sp. DS 682]